MLPVRKLGQNQKRYFEFLLEGCQSPEVSGIYLSVHWVRGKCTDRYKGNEAGQGLKRENWNVVGKGRGGKDNCRGPGF